MRKFAKKLLAFTYSSTVQIMAEIFSHPILGKLVPKSLDGVNQFLGLKYASIKDRLAAPELYSPTSGEVIDATQHGQVYFSHTTTT
jgi:hypothetical protein